MKSFSAAVILFLSLVSVSGAFAVEGAKLGTVDIQKILLLSDAGKEAKDQLAQKARKYEEEKNAKDEELKKLNSELENQRQLLSESARSAKERAYQQRLKEYQRFLKDAQEDLQGKNDELTNRIVEEIIKVAQEYGRKNGYTAIFVRNDIIVYLDEKADLTEEVMKQFNLTKKK